MGVDGGGGEHHRHADAALADALIGQEQFAAPGAHRIFGLAADTGNRLAQRRGVAADFEGAIDVGDRIAEIGAQPVPIVADQHRRVDHQHMVALPALIEDVGEVGEARFQAHHMAFA